MRGIEAGGGGDSRGPLYETLISVGCIWDSEGIWLFGLNFHYDNEALKCITLG